MWALPDAMPEHLRPAILLGAFAGLRLAEACGLRVSDVDFMRGVISPAVQYPAEPLKSETSKTPVPIPQSLALELSAQVDRTGADTMLTDLYGNNWPRGRSSGPSAPPAPRWPASRRRSVTTT